MPKTVFFNIFDTKICPQLLYGAEVWGLETFIDLEYRRSNIMLVNVLCV